MGVDSGGPGPLLITQRGGIRLTPESAHASD
jgi:hypothetical protein